MTDTPDAQLASDAQLAELRSLAQGEDIPDGMRATEAEQRLVELRALKDAPSPDR